MAFLSSVLAFVSPSTTGRAPSCKRCEQIEHDEALSRGRIALQVQGHTRPRAAGVISVSNRPHVVAILLAAGESSRMGRPKSLLEWKGLTLIEYQVRELRAAGVDEVIAVLGSGAEAVRPAAERGGARVALNPAYREGRAGSIRVGALAVDAAAEAIVLLNVDQPRDRSISAAILSVHLRAGNVITVPAFHGRRGHPVVLTGGLLDELRAVREESEGLRALIRFHAAQRVELPMDDPTVLLDLNLPAEYEAARAREAG